MKSVAFHNLGCKVNSYESDVMQQMLTEKGYQIVPFDEVADIYIINTCTVTNIADRKSRQMLHRAKQKNPGAVVVAVGCYAQTHREQVEADGSVDLVIGNNRKKDLALILEQFLAGRESDKTLHGSTVTDINAPCAYEEMTLRQTAEHTRAYIKIQDGCNQFCSYCIIPYARGRVRSRREEDILAEIRGLTAKGYREIVLTGIHISSYGIDFGEGEPYRGESGLIDLVEHIHESVEGLDRIRLGSLEPRVITEETAARLAALPKLCPHFHLSLQSGCDETLRRMNRHYTSGEYLQKVECLRRAFDHPAITTDVIVGFPGETEEEFARSRDFLERVGFFEMHIFKYSERAGTRAAGMSGQLTDRVKSERSDVLFELEAEQSRAFRADYIGKQAEILWEDRRLIGDAFYWLGHTKDYVKVAVPAGEEKLSNTLSTARIRDFLTDEILLAEA
ncbi:MAG: tRNA (N(6)-L-threonylcarbamoyladenosine(37)-C(2))-methylthiotransferase MtaB [Clostridium sp.]|nr:tRNA (N(6)-L-threonylcarbamoyladenosine(37)-C(2))-methylthiotransferase MtaB [Acetatifactor muris]MCM1528156.1 tRNA (N(6)-L-threonylcarbamoyladenosine(37)-C(2))-methylthiotransferase MtaB [Bacteroides sp.]MCM1562746.1 tRNA (N(6)-L-threonylcarbamoyladenosine(37)-C(2))-methylthiotransferase MtaB [Clostridium sp.]